MGYKNGEMPKPKPSRLTLLQCQKVCRLCWKFLKIQISNLNLRNFFKSTSFLRCHPIFQKIQGFIAFWCGNIWHFEAKKAQKKFFDPRNWNLQGCCAVWYMRIFFFFRFDFFDFSIEKVMEASKKFTRQCNHFRLYTKYGSKILHKLSWNCSLVPINSVRPDPWTTCSWVYRVNWFI